MSGTRQTWSLHRSGGAKATAREVLLYGEWEWGLTFLDCSHWEILFKY